MLTTSDIANNLVPNAQPQFAPTTQNILSCRMDASAIHVDGKMCGLAAVPNPFGDQSVIPALPDEYEAYAAMVAANLRPRGYPGRRFV